MKTRFPASHSRTKAQRGNSLMEFALSGGVLFLLTFGVVDFARLFYIGNVVTSAAAAGTQFGALSPAHYGDYDGMKEAAKTDAQNPTGLLVEAGQFCACSIGGAKVSCPAACGSGTPQRYIQVTASMPYTTMVNYPGIPNTTAVKASSIIRVQ